MKKRNVLLLMLIALSTILVYGCSSKKELSTIGNVSYKISPDLERQEQTNEGMTIITYNEKDVSLDDNNSPMTYIMISLFPMENVDIDDSSAQKTYFESFIDDVSQQSGTEILKAEDSKIGDFNGKLLAASIKDDDSSYAIRIHYFYVDNNIYCAALATNMDYDGKLDNITNIFNDLIDSFKLK